MTEEGKHHQERRIDAQAARTHAQGQSEPRVAAAQTRNRKQTDSHEDDRFAHLGRRLSLFLRRPSAAWLIEYPDAIKRHVETLTIHSVSSAHRHLTIDLVLPPSGFGRTTWMLPVTRLAKADLTSFIDLMDERGRTIALPTRQELAAVTRAVLHPHIVAFGRSPKEREALEAALTTLVYQEPQHAQIGLFFIVNAALRHGIEISDRMAETLRQLVDNSIVWLPLTGTPGQRKVVKLSYSIRLLRPVVPARHPLKRRMNLQWVLTSSSPEGPVDLRRTLRRMRARLTGRMGWDALDLFLNGPVLQDPLTYHLQVSAPPGLHVTELSVEEDDLDNPAQVSDSNRHLYIRAPRPRRTQTIRIKIRAERRGFMNASAASTLALAGLLWMFARNSAAVTQPAALSPGAAVLLIAPALMALFVSRPTESALVSTTLTGVRTALGISAISSLLAAASLPGARLTGDAEATLTACAGVSTAAWISVMAAWLGTFHIVRKHGNRARGFWCGEPETRRSWTLAAGTLTCLALAAWAVLLFFNAFSMTRHPQLDIGLLVVVPLIAACVWWPKRKGNASHGIVFVTAAASLAAASLAIVIAAHGLHVQVPTSTRDLALGVGGALAGFALTAAISAELAPIESPSTWAKEHL